MQIVDLTLSLNFLVIIFSSVLIYKILILPIMISSLCCEGSLMPDILAAITRNLYLLPVKRNGDNIVQGYGQKICLKTAILDFPGLKQTAWKTSSVMTAASCHAYPSCYRGTSWPLGTNLKVLVCNNYLERIAALTRMSIQLIFCPNTSK